MGFQLNQICSGEGMKFKVTSLEPLTVLCLEVEGWWKTYGTYRDQHGTHYVTWQVGESYPLTLGSSQMRNFNFSSPLPWCSVYEDGTVRHYR